VLASFEQRYPALSGSAGRWWRLRLRCVVLWQGGDDLDRFHADADDLSDEADDVLGVVGVVGIRADAGAFVFLHAVLIDDLLDRAAVAEVVFEDLQREALPARPHRTRQAAGAVWVAGVSS